MIANEKAIYQSSNDMDVCMSLYDLGANTTAVMVNTIQNHSKCRFHYYMFMRNAPERNHGAQRTFKLQKEMPLTHNLYTKLKSLGLLFLYMIIGPAYTFITARN